LRVNGVSKLKKEMELFSEEIKTKPFYRRVSRKDKIKKPKKKK
jgi:hypothetical protein